MRIQRFILPAVLTIGISLSAPADEPADIPAAVTKDVQLQLNFKDVPLQTVLDYLSKAGGFVIIGEPEVEGTITVSSHQPLNRNEAVQLLDTILSEKGYAAIRNDRMLQIVSKSSAKSHDLPVIKGNDPIKIPKSDSMVTQIIPVRYTDAASLLENIQPLLAGHAEVSCNKTSNAIILTDTQINIRRIASIIQALDSSISDISTVKVFPMVYGDPASIANIITTTFKAPTSGSGKNNNDLGGMLPFLRGKRDKKGKGADKSDAQNANTHLSAVGDVRSNSVVVCAPSELLPSIEQLIKELDVPTEKSAEIQVYMLKYADATAMAATINELFNPETSSQSNTNGSQEDARMSRIMERVSGRTSKKGKKSNKNAGTDARSLGEGPVTAVADIRTNSVIVTATEDRHASIKVMLATLDDGPSRSPRVFVYKIKHADLENLKEMLEEMFEDVDDLNPSASSTSATGRGSFATRNTNANKTTKKNNRK